MEFKFEIDDITLVAEKYVKLLGLNLDKNLNYDTHIQQICKKSWQPFKCLEKTHHISVSTIEWQYFAVSYCVISSSVALCGIFAEWGTPKRWGKFRREGCVLFMALTSDYDSLLCKSKMASLKLGRERNIAIQTYKIKTATSYIFEKTNNTNTKFKISPAFI